MIGASDYGVVAVEFDSGQELCDSDNHSSTLDQCARQLEEYFAGFRDEFDLPLHLRGTEFQSRCWKQLMDIPYGETRTYAQVAEAIGQPRAFRAVGMANHENPIAVIIPCHRVIASDGKLGGYAGGVMAKQWLLDLERRVVGNAKDPGKRLSVVGGAKLAKVAGE